MNWLAIAGGAAVLVIYLAGRKAQKDLSDEPPIFGDYADGATGTDGGGYYGGGGGGDGGLVAGVGALAPIGAGVQASSDGTFSRSAEAGKTLAEVFTDSLGFGSLERGDAKVDLGAPSGTLERSGTVTIPLPQARSAQVGAALASTAPYSTSTLSMSSTPATANNSFVTTQAVQSQPVRTLSAPVATISARSVSLVPVQPVPAPVAPRLTPVSTSYSFLNDIGRGPNGATVRR